MEISTLSKQELKTLIDQSETAFKDFKSNGDSEKCSKLNIFIGKLIDIYNEAPGII